MEWLVIGAGLAAAGWWLADWARARQVTIRWYVWILGVLAAVMAALAVTDYRTLSMEMEPGAASIVIWLFGGPALILACSTAGLVWWQNRTRMQQTGSRQ